SSSWRSSACATPAKAATRTASSARTRMRRKRTVRPPVDRPTPARWARKVATRHASVPPVTEPALWGLRRSLLDWGDRLHLAAPAVRAYELLLAAKSGLVAHDPEQAGGFPLPPPRLRAQAGPRHAEAGYFLRSGERHAA